MTPSTASSAGETASRVFRPRLLHKYVLFFAATVPGLGSASYSSSRGGLAAGGGIETAFAHNWTAKLEYLYLDTGKVTYATGLPGVTLNSQGKDHVIRFGLNYLFH